MSTITAREELATYLSMRVPFWSEDHKAIRAVRSHGHTEEQIRAAARAMASEGKLQERESSVRYLGQRVMMWRQAP